MGRLISRFYLLFAVTICCFGQASAQPTSQLLVGKIDTTKIRLDGLYSLYDTTVNELNGIRAADHYLIDHQLVFLKDGRIYLDIGSLRKIDTPITRYYNAEFYSQKINKESIGIYRIHGDTIYAIIPTVFGVHSRAQKAHFRGYIKNQDTILDWKLVPPYPKVPAGRKESIEWHATPRLRFFIKYESVRALEDALKK